jgi:NAD(P)-dependent dehydrogenase (short-subunit alcohol dehydrogenase family)
LAVSFAVVVGPEGTLCARSLPRQRYGSATTRGGSTAKPRRRGLIAAIPIDGFGRPAEVAHAILYLASDESAYITGTELVLDGGTTA